MPVSTISRWPLATRRRTSSTICSAGRLARCGRTLGMMQKLQSSMQPSCTFTYARCRAPNVIDIPTGISSTFGARHRAYVKVQDGCMLHCSFCIIPKVRPHLASRPAEHIVDEVRRLVASGHREIVLTGIHLGHYGVEWNRGRAKSDWLRLSHLVERLCHLDGDFRIR